MRELGKTIINTNKYFLITYRESIVSTMFRWRTKPILLQDFGSEGDGMEVGKMYRLANTIPITNEQLGIVIYFFHSNCAISICKE